MDVAGDRRFRSVRMTHGGCYTTRTMSSGEKIRKIVDDRKAAHAKLLAAGSETYRAFLEMERATFTDRALTKMHKELIALGISVVNNCESCMEWHIHQALESGASSEQVLETIEVGMEMGGGPATVASRFALQVLEHYSGES